MVSDTALDCFVHEVCLRVVAEGNKTLSFLLNRIEPSQGGSKLYWPMRRLGELVAPDPITNPASLLWQQIEQELVVMPDDAQSWNDLLHKEVRDLTDDLVKQFVREDNGLCAWLPGGNISRERAYGGLGLKQTGKATTLEFDAFLAMELMPHLPECEWLCGGDIYSRLRASRFLFKQHFIKEVLLPSNVAFRLPESCLRLALLTPRLFYTETSRNVDTRSQEYNLAIFGMWYFPDPQQIIIVKTEGD